MRNRDLLKLPLGKYELTDSISNYYYVLTKALNKDGTKIYSIVDRNFSLAGGRVSLFEETEIVDTGCYIYKRKYFSSISGVGGLSIYSKENYRLIRELQFIQSVGSFKKFIEVTK